MIRLAVFLAFLLAVSAFDICAVITDQPACLSFGLRCAFCEGKCVDSEGIWNEARAQEFCVVNATSLAEQVKARAFNECRSVCDYACLVILSAAGVVLGVLLLVSFAYTVVVFVMHNDKELHCYRTPMTLITLALAYALWELLRWWYNYDCVTPCTK